MTTGVVPQDGLTRRCSGQRFAPPLIAEPLGRHDLSASEEKTYVFLAVFDYGGDAGDVTSVVGLAPTRSWRKAEPHGKRGGRRTHDRWEFSTPAPSGAAVDAKLEALLGVLEATAAGVRATADRFRAEIWCVCYSDYARSGFQFSRDFLQRIADLRLSLAVDLYGGSRP